VPYSMVTVTSEKENEPQKMRCSFERGRKRDIGVREHSTDNTDWVQHRQYRLGIAQTIQTGYSTDSTDWVQHRQYRLGRAQTVQTG